MQVNGLMWVGTRTSKFAETRNFFETIFELPVGIQREHFVRFQLPDYGSVEVFDAHSDPYTHFTTGPVIRIQVLDFDQARTELASKGYDLLGDAGGEYGVYRWQHFRGPGGAVLEIVDYPNRPPPLPPIGRMQITRLAFMGIATSKFEETVEFYKDILKAKIIEEDSNQIECHLPDGSSVEAFRRGSNMDHPYLQTGPLPGFGVKDYHTTIEVLQEFGVPILQTRVGKWGGWAHFRAPDGCVYEITDRLENK